MTAAFLRLGSIGTHPLWLDEVFSLQCANGMSRAFAMSNGWIAPVDVAMPRAQASVGDVWRSVLTAKHPPGYFLSLHAWMQVFHGSEARLRLLSAVCSLVAIGGLFVALLRWLGWTPALYAAAILALAEQELFVARFVRAYAMAGMFLCLALAVLAGIQTRGPTRLRALLLAVCLVGMAMTHYSTIPALIAIVIYAAVALRERARWTALAGVVLAAAIVAVAWGPSMLRQAGGAQDGAWLVDQADGHAKRTAIRLAAAPVKLLSSSPRLPQALTMATAAALFTLPIVFFRRRPAILIFWLLLATIVGGLAISDLTGGLKRLAEPRYTLLATPAIAALIAACSRRWGHIVPAVTVGICLITLPRSIDHPFFEHNARHKAFGQMLGEQVQSTDAVVFAGSSPNALELSGVRDTYIHYAANKPAPIAQLDLQNPGKLLDELKRFPRVWIVAVHEDAPLVDQFGVGETTDFKNICRVRRIDR